MKQNEMMEDWDSDEIGKMVSMDIVLTKENFEMIKNIYNGKEAVGCFIEDDMAVNIFNEEEHKAQQMEESIAFANSVQDKTIGELSHKELEEILDNSRFMIDFLHDNREVAEAALQSIQDDSITG